MWINGKIYVDEFNFEDILEEYYQTRLKEVAQRLEKELPELRESVDFLKNEKARLKVERDNLQKEVKALRAERARLTEPKKRTCDEHD